MSKYRLRPKPGIAKAGRFVNTKINPVIIPNNMNNMVRSSDPQVISVHPSDLQKVIVKSPVKKINKIRSQRPVLRQSPLHHRKEMEIGQYKKAVEDLKDIGKGRILIMVACGPSILEVELTKLLGHKLIDFMSINKPYAPLGFTKYWVFCDQSQYIRNKDTFDNWKGMVINAWSVRARHPNQVLVRNCSGNGFSKDLHRGYYIGRSTTYANMQTAFWMNYDKIYIFGCDMSSSTDLKQLHFYGTNPDVKPEIRVTRFQREAEHYASGAKQLTPLERSKFVFCSSYNKWPFIDQFEKLDHKIAVDNILNKANEMMQK
jgi:hypothetical protein